MLSRVRRGYFVTGVVVAGLAAGASIYVAEASGLTLGTCTDNFTGASGGDWATAGNWSTGKVPVSSDVACWPVGTTVVVSTNSQTADSIQGGALVISGGSLSLSSSTNDSTLSGMTLTGGTFNGPTGRTLQLDGDFDWDATGTTSGINTNSGGITIAQSGTHNFTIEGSQTEYFYGGGLTTSNPITISNANLYAAFNPTLTASGNTITFTAPGAYQGNSMTMNAAGIVTKGGAFTLPYTLHLTGSSSSLGGDLGLSALNTDGSTSLTVPSGDHLYVGGGTLNGTVTGQGTYTQTGGTTTIAGGGVLSTDDVVINAGTLTAASDGAYSPPVATTINGGTLQMNNSGSTGSLTMTGGILNGPGTSTLTVAGDFDWNVTSGSAGINTNSGGMKLVQTGSHAFTIEGSAPEYFYGGSMTTSNPVAISNTNFYPAFNPTLTVNGNTVGFLSAGSYSGNSLTMNATGIVTSSGAVNLPYTLHVTGSSSQLGGDLSLGSLNTDASTTLTVPTADNLSSGGGTLNGAVIGQGTYTQTGGTTTIAGGGALSSNNVSVTGGTLINDGTYSPATATTISGGTLQMTAGGSTGNLTMTGGSLNGSGGSTLTIAGNFDWNATGNSSQINNVGSSALALVQTGSHAFKIEGSQPEYFYGGSMTTPNPVIVTNPGFTPGGSPTLTATNNTISFTAANYGGGSGLTINADGVKTSGGTVSLPYTVHLTGSASNLGGDLSLSTLNTDSSTTLTVPSSERLSVNNGTINGAIAGNGTYEQTGGTTTITGNGALSIDNVSVSGGTLSDSGGYSAGVGTVISGGNLQLNTGGSTGDLTMVGGYLNGSGGQTLTINGNFDWNPTTTTSAINNQGSGALALLQKGTGSFTIEGSQPEYFYGGSMTTPNPVTISNTAFSPANNPTLTASGTTVSFKVPGPYSGGGLTINAAGVNTPAGATTLPYTLNLTGGSTSVPAGSTLGANAVNLSGGALQVDGTLNSPVTLNGGTLNGGGTVSGKVTNTNGTVAPGDSPGMLSVGNGYSQGPGGTLAVEVDGTTSGQYARLNVTGNVALDGTLALQPSAAYAASAKPGDTVGFLTYSGTRTGTFATSTVNPPLTNAEPFTPDYSTANVVHAVVGNGTPDTTPPQSSASSPTYSRNLTIPVTYSDTDQGGSGVATLQLWAKGPTDAAYSLAKALSAPPSAGTINYIAAEGDGNYSFYTQAIDNAGNTEAAPGSSETVTQLDTTAPQVTIAVPADGGQYTQGATVNTNYGCTDPDGSGIANCSGPVTSGGALDTSALGTHSFTVDAADNAGNTTSRTVNYTVVTAPAPPSATTGGVHDLAATSATLLGTVDPNGADTSYWFEYGTDQSYGQKTSSQDAGSQNGYSAASDVSGLQPSTLYHYRLVAQQGNGTPVDGADQTFTTPALAVPTNTSLPAISGTAQVNQTLTALNGSWTGGPTGYSYQWLACDTNGANCQNIATNATGQHFDVTSNQLGETIRVQVTASNPGGSSQPAQSSATDPVAPAASTGGGGTFDATTGSANNITGTTATITGLVDPNGSAAKYYFVYGKSPQGGLTTTLTDTGTSNGFVATADLTGLDPGTTYYYYVAAVQGVNTVYGAQRTFRTLGPIVTTGAASSITPASATVSGAVDPRGSNTTYHFEYGTSSAYGDTAPAPDGTVPAAAGGSETVTANLTGLDAAKTYHYRLVATNADGTSDGADKTFKTSVGPPVINSETGSGSATSSGASFKVNVSLNTFGLGGKVTLDYGTDTSYGNSTAVTLAGSATQASLTATTNVYPGATYHYQLVATSTAGSSTSADDTVTIPAVAPGATTGSAQDLGGGNLKLSGTVSPNGAATSYYFQITEPSVTCGGKTIRTGGYSQYTTPTGPATATSTSGTIAAGSWQQVPVTATVVVPAGQNIEYQLVASNGGGSTDGQTNSIFVKGTPATADQESATSIQATGAILNVIAQPGGKLDVPDVQIYGQSYDQSEVVYQPAIGFHYGTTSGYGSETGYSTWNDDTCPFISQQTIAGLSAGTTYHYEAVDTGPTPCGPYGCQITPAQDHAVFASLSDATFTTPAGGSGGGVVVLSGQAGTLGTNVTCQASLTCSGKVQIKTIVASKLAGDGSVARAQALVIGQGSFRIAAHQRATVRIKLTTLGRRLLRQGRLSRVTESLQIRAGGGRMVTTTKVVRLSRQRATRSRTRSHH